MLAERGGVTGRATYRNITPADGCASADGWCESPPFKPGANLTEENVVPVPTAKRIVDLLIEDLAIRARDDTGLEPFVARLHQARDDGFEPRHDVRPSPVPAGFPKSADEIAAAPLLAELLVKAGGQSAWNPVVADQPNVDPALQAGMHAAHLFGINGPLGCKNIRGGLFSLAPNIHYPLHTHLATELYYCVSGVLTLQHGLDGEPLNLHAGEYSITPSDRLHSLTTADDPVLLIFSWIGEFAAPIYWWAKEGQEWGRTAWQRTPDGSWEAGERMPVDAGLLSQQTLG